MADLTTIRKILEKHILESGHTFREISLKIGRKDSYIQQYVKYGFPKRLNEVDRKRICQVLDIDERQLMDDELLRHGIPETPVMNLANLDGTQADYISIDIIEPRPNQHISYSRVVGRIAINYKEFYGWCNGNPYNLKIMRLNSDNMEPSVPSGSLIIYDSSIFEYAGDGLYIIQYDEQITLKRLQKTSSDNFILKSENPRYQDIRCANDEIKILGRALNSLITRPL